MTHSKTFDDLDVKASHIYESAKSNGRYDAGGILLELNTTQPDPIPLIISCSGVVPNKIMYAMEASSSEIQIHKLFVCDVNCEWYQNGIEGFTSCFDDTLELIARIVQLVNPIKAYALGTSAGGYMALTLAACLGLDRALALGPQTIIEMDWLKANGDSRWDVYMARIYAGATSSLYFDVRKTIQTQNASHGWRRPRYTILYPAADAMDRKHALRLAGIAGVELIEVAGAEHNVSAFLRDAGHLSDLIAIFIEGGDCRAIIGYSK